MRTHNERPTTTSTITPPPPPSTATATTTTKKPVFISAFAKGDVYRYDFGINRANVVAIYASVGVYLWLCVRAYAFCCLHFCVCMCECVSVGDLSPSTTTISSLEPMSSHACVVHIKLPIPLCVSSIKHTNTFKSEALDRIQLAHSLTHSLTHTAHIKRMKTYLCFHLCMLLLLLMYC